MHEDSVALARPLYSTSVQIADTVRLVNPAPFDRDALLELMRHAVSNDYNVPADRHEWDNWLRRVFLGLPPPSTTNLSISLGGFERIDTAGAMAMKLKLFRAAK
jgi:hypothetical protein